MGGAFFVFNKEDNGGVVALGTTNDPYVSMCDVNFSGNVANDDNNTATNNDDIYAKYVANLLPSRNIRSNATTICTGESIQLSFNFESSNGPFGITVNGTVYNNLRNGDVFLTQREGTYFTGTTNYTLSRIVDANGCEYNDLNQIITIYVNTVNAGSIGGAQTICTGRAPTTLTSTTDGTGAGTITYRWEKSTTNCSTGFSPIMDATEATYDPPAGLSQTTYFRRVAISTLNGVVCEKASNCVTVTLGDNIPPSITCPATQTLALGANCSATLPNYTGLATTSDNCGIQGVTQSPVAGTSVFGTGTMTVTLTVTDINGNPNSCTFTVTKVDNTPPSITCPATQTLALGANCSATLPNYTGLATTSDNCGIQGVTQSPVAGTSVFGVGTMTVTLTVTDINGNPNSCTFSVTKVDNISPSITCPATQTLALGANCSATLPNYTSLAVVSDNCGIKSVTQLPAQGTNISGVGSMTVTITATDDNGNPSSCTFMVNKVDNTPPTITTGSINSCYATVAAAEAAALAATSATDNCVGILTKTASTAGTCSAVITVGVTDANNNYSTTTYNTRIDNTPPTLTCPAPITVCGPAAIPIPDITLVTNVTDNCTGAVTVTHQGDSSSGSSTTVAYTVTRTYRATDACGNFTECSQIITVNPIPNAVATPSSQTICSAAAINSIALSGNVATTTYNWTRDNTVTVTGVASNGSGNIDGSLTTNALTTVTFTITPTANNCLGTSIEATVLVNPLPTVTITGTTAVCQNSPRPQITFTGSNGTAPYTFTYSLKGTEKTVTTENGNSVSVEALTNEAGTFEYSLVSVKDGSSTACSQTQTGSATVTVNPLPTATISGTTTVCQNSPSLSITFTGSNTTAPYTFTYKINDGVSQTVTTVSGNSVTVPVSTNTAGTFTYTLVSVSESSSTACSQTQSGSATVTVNPLPTASISGTTTVCQNSPSPNITFTGANATAPYTFTYKINDGSLQTVTTVSGNSVTIPVSTTTVGEFTYTLLSVSESSSTSCSQVQSGSVVVKIQGKPTITLSTLQQTLNEGNSQTFCDIDANPVNNMQFTVATGCVVGAPVWRFQVGSGAWSDWSPNAPVFQPSNNQPHRYQAACDANCASTYSGVIELTINNRATVPQNVSLSVDGVTVLVGESKEVCSLVTIPLMFNANCAVGEVTLYSVDGGEYSSGVPTGLVDNQFHNYRVRCRKSDGTPSCVESESGVMRLKLVTIPSAPTVSLSSTSSCDATAIFSGQSSCGSLRTVWYNATTNVALPNLPSTVPSQTTSYYARCQTENGCVSERSNVVTFTLTPTQVAPVITASQDIVCTGTSVTISANCPSGSQTFWNTGVTTPSFEVSFNNVTKQTYWAKCIFGGGCQSSESLKKDIYWNAFVVTLINVGESQSSVKVNDRAAWLSQFIQRDGGPELEQSTQQNPTLYFVENANKVAPRYWTINVEACGLSTDGSLTFDMLATPEMGVIRSFNTHENNAPYFMYANREGWTELYAQNHPAYGFYQDNGAGANVYDLGLPKGLYKLGIRYWDMKGWGSIYPSTRKPQGNVLAYQEYWFRIQSKEGVGLGGARTAGEQGASNSALIPPSRVRGLLVLPNPVTNILRLQVQDSKGQEVKTILLDAAGREVLSRKFVPETNMHHEEFGVSSLANGLYFLQVRTFEQQATLKVVKNE